MNKRKKGHGSRFVPKKEAKILNHGRNLKSSATTPLQQEESSQRYNRYALRSSATPIQQEESSKRYYSLPETKKADDFHQPSPGGEDRNNPGHKTAATTPFLINPKNPCCDCHPIYGMLCANVVLDYYNKNNVKNFELVADKLLRCGPLINSYGSCDTSIRCVFMAKDDSSIKKFSAQLDYVYHQGLNVSICSVSEDDDDDDDDELRYEIINSADERQIGCGSLSPDSPASPAYTTVSPNYDPVAFHKLRRLRSKRIAEIALNDYNEKNGKGPKYELKKDDVIENRFFSDTSGGWFHCGFYAVDSSTRQVHRFFAELKYSYPSKPYVYSCTKLTDGRTTCDCCMCYPEMVHPAGADGKFLRGSSLIVQKDTPPKNKSPTDAHPYDYWKYFGIYEDPRIPINAGDDHCSRDRRIFGMVFANIVLYKYNSEKDSSFTLVEDGSLYNEPKIESSGFRIIIHCRFVAEQNFSMRLFSADLKYARGSDLIVTSYNDDEIPENDKEDRKHEKYYVGEVKDIADESSATTPLQQGESSLRFYLRQ